jgi:hypothetical protein
MSYEHVTIMSELNRIQNHELLLPDIQRDFVWTPDRIYRLLDSILRGYPFGTLLFWNTRDEIQYREFEQNWRANVPRTYQVKPAGVRGTIVLDGQQRLQSLYLSVYGSYDGKFLCVDLLSGQDQTDVSELRYHFEFLAPGEASSRNQGVSDRAYWIPLRDIACLGDRRQRSAARAAHLKLAGLEDGTTAGALLGTNFDTIYDAFRSDELVNFYSIDHQYGDDNVHTPVDEILEIFVRVNSGGQVLSKSDLMFSLLKLHWRGAVTEVADLVDALNRKGRFSFDKDFVLKCALVCLNRGARYDVEKFRVPGALDEISANFERLSRALAATVEFAVNIGHFIDGRVLGSYNALIPFVYFLYQQPEQRIGDEETGLAMNHALYLGLMTGGFTHYADNRIDYLVQHILAPAQRNQPGVFPLDAIQRFLADREGRGEVDNWLLQNNVPLVMNILEGGSLLPEGRRQTRPEYDHIFPRSKLAGRYTDEQINDYANFRLLSEILNKSKSDADPLTYFAGHADVMDRYLIPAKYLDYDHFPEFLVARRALIWERVRRFLGLGDTPLTGRPVTPPTSAPASPGGDQPPVADPGARLAVMRLALTRLAPSNGQRQLYRALYDAGEAGLAWSELYNATGRTYREMMGVIGTLGRRVNQTEGAKALGNPGSGLFIKFSRRNGYWHYAIHPQFKQLLDDDLGLRELALPQ